MLYRAVLVTTGRLLLGVVLALSVMGASCTEDGASGVVAPVGSGPSPVPATGGGGAGAPPSPALAWEQTDFADLDWFTDVVPSSETLAASSSGVFVLAGEEPLLAADMFASDMTSFGDQVVAVGFAPDGRTPVTAVIDGKGEATVREVAPVLQRVTELADGLVGLAVGSSSGSWQVLRSEDGLDWEVWHDLPGRWFGGWVAPSGSDDAAVAVLIGEGREIHVRRLGADGVTDLGVIHGVHAEFVRTTGGRVFVGGRRSIGPLRGALLSSPDGREWTEVEVAENEGGNFLDVIEVEGRLLVAGALRRADGADAAVTWRQTSEGWVRAALSPEPGAARFVIQTPSGIAVLGHTGTLGRGEGARVWTHAAP